MNIFEALEIGMGKATLPIFDDVAYWKDGYGFCWEKNHYPLISLCYLQCNGWVPYVPPEERKIEGLVYFVPRETCYNCGQVIPPKRERKVIVRVKWKTVDGKTIVYPVFQGFGVDYQSFPSKPEMKMTLEWEE